MGPRAVPGRALQLSQARRSPNHGERRGGLVPELVVIHHTAMASAGAALARLCDSAAEVSAHYLIEEDGRVHALVPEERRAWHAGAGSWGGRGDVNSRSIGIELQNDARSPFAAAQMDALEALLGGILKRHAIAAKGVIAHSDMAPDRKADPGPRFDWRRLAHVGLSVWPKLRGATEGRPAAAPEVPHPEAEVTLDRIAAALHRFGYDGDPGLRLAAFRLRFRPGVSGPATQADLAMAEALARDFPVLTSLDGS